MTEKKPNIILLILDGMRSDRLGCYGYKRPTSPNIDRLAQKSSVFLNNYSVSFCSMPGHISMFTGANPQFHGAASNFSYFDGKLPHLVDLLSANGYYTYGISSANPYFTIESGFISGFDQYCRIQKANKRIQTHAKKIFGKAVSTDQIIQKLLRTFNKKKFHNNILDFYKKHDFSGRRLVDKLKEDIILFPKDKPSFIFANILEAHGPFLPPEGFRDVFGKNEITDKLMNIFYQPYYYRDQRGKIALTPEEQTTLDNLYDGCVLYVDYLVGELVKFLEESGRLEDTVIIIASDHGAMLNEHDGLIFHDGTYQEIIRVPMIVYAPQKESAVEKGLASVIDIMPTVLDAAKINLPDVGFQYQGRSLLSNKVGHDCVVSEIPPIPFPSRLSKYPRMVADYLHTNRTIVTEDLKLIWRSNGQHLIFNLKEDPKEKRNLFPSIGKETFLRLKDQMVNWYESQMNSENVFCLERFEYTLFDIHAGLPPRTHYNQNPANVHIVEDRPLRSAE